jgi:hypothetical protein
MTLIKHSSEGWQYGRECGCVILHKTLGLYIEGHFVKDWIAISHFSFYSLPEARNWIACKNNCPKPKIWHFMRYYEYSRIYRT